MRSAFLIAATAFLFTADAVAESPPLTSNGQQPRQAVGRVNPATGALKWVQHPLPATASGSSSPPMESRRANTRFCIGPIPPLRHNHRVHHCRWHSSCRRACRYGPALRGEHFWTTWGDKSARELYGCILSTMPSGDPGSLSPKQVRALMAFILATNGYPAGATSLESPAQLDAVKISKAQP